MEDMKFGMGMVVTGKCELISDLVSYLVRAHISGGEILKAVEIFQVMSSQTQSPWLYVGVLP